MAAGARPTAIGADGSRPQLAWAGVAARPPPPHAPAAAPQQATPGGAQQRVLLTAGTAPAPAQRVAARPVVDEEGFTLVQRSASAAARQQLAADAPQSPGTGQLGGQGGRPDPSASSMDEDGGGPMDMAGEEGQDHVEGAEAGEGGEPVPTADALKEEWQSEQKLLELLIQRGYPAEHPVREAAQRQADAAHKAWTDASPGVAITQRLLWADKALQRARKGHARLEQELDELDRRYETERDELCGRLHEQRGRVKMREAKLAELSREAAGAFQTTDGSTHGGIDAIREAVATIEGDLAPAMRAAHELAPEGSPLRAKLEEAMGAITTVHGMAAQASRARWADVYYMSEGDDTESRGYDDWGGDGWHWAHDQWSRANGGATWRDEDWDHRAWSNAARAREDGGEAAMDTGDVQAPLWMRAEGCSDTHWGGRSWKRGRREAEDATGLQGRLLGGGSGPEEIGHERLAMLQAQWQDGQAQGQEHQQSGHQQHEAGAGITGAAPPTPRAEDHALEARRRAIWDQAQNDGVEISAEEVASMDAVVLEEWAAAHLL